MAEETVRSKVDDLIPKLDRARQATDEGAALIDGHRMPGFRKPVCRSQPRGTSANDRHMAGNIRRSADLTVATWKPPAH